MKTALLIFITFLLCLTNGFSQAAGDYRSFASGTWATVGNWERFNGVSWINPAPTAPSSTDGVITIQASHTMQIAANVSLDQVIINSGGTINWTGGTCTFVNGAGVDLQVDGTFWDNRGTTVTSITFTASTWQMGANGTLRRSAGNSSNNWQNAYQGGIATIPATSNWVLQKNNAQNPSITTIGAFYGNLIIENNVGGIWNVPAASSFQGAGGFPTIKGNFDLGGTGSSTTNFLNQHTNAQPTLVQGNVLIRAGNIFANTGTGLEIQGNLTNNGTINYSGVAGRKLVFSGGSAQTIINTGSLGIYDFTINKSANSLTLNNPITVDNLATFTNGIINSSNPNFFILNTSATVSGASNTSFVSGPVRRLGPTGIVFPVGKVASYRMIGIGNGSAGAVTNIFTENFNTAGAGWTLNQVMGAEGADANFFTVSANEGGTVPTFAPVGVGIAPNLGAPTSCGVAANGNNTLHVTSVFNPTGGAAYDAGGLCGLLFCPLANRQAVSPTINTTGFVGLELVFDYIENGAATLDNGSCYYSIDNGVSWILLDDMPKTTTGCGGQGVWVTRTLTLPPSCDNITTLKVAFRWVNNDDGAGTDPSMAIDNVIVRQAAPISSFTAEYFPTNPQVPYGNVLVPSLTALSNCEYWILNRDAGTDARTVTLSWNAASCFNTAFASFQVARYDGISTWQDHDGTPVGSAAGGTITTPLSVSSFSPFAIAYVPLPLPIELLDFYGNCEAGKIKLQWQTASETNNAYFNIEKSEDLQNWTLLRTISGAGNSNTITSYEIIDNNPYPAAYYRLTQTDFNGQSEIFDPISIYCNDAVGSVNVYPNPTTGIVNISLPTGSILEAIELNTSHGQFVLQSTPAGAKGGTNQTIDLSSLQSGTYYLRMLVDGNWITKPVYLIK